MDMRTDDRTSRLIQMRLKAIQSRTPLEGGAIPKESQQKLLYKSKAPHDDIVRPSLPARPGPVFAQAPTPDDPR